MDNGGNGHDGAGNDAQREPESSRKLFIGGLDFRTTEESLKAFYETWGEIVDVVVMKDPKTKRSRGFGFITYSQSTMLDEAQANRPHVIDGRTVEPKRAIPRNASDNSGSVKKLFVAGLKDEVTEDEMREYFSQFGTVVNVVLVTEKETGKKRGFGFVEYDDYDPVDKACIINSHMLSGKKVDVKKAIGKTEMARMKGPRHDQSWSRGGDDQWANDWSGGGGGWGQGGFGDGYSDGGYGGGPMRGSAGGPGGRSAPYRTGGGRGGRGGGGGKGAFGRY